MCPHISVSGLSLYLHVSLYPYVSVCVCVSTFQDYLCICMNIYIHMYLCVSMCPHIRIISVSACISISICICVCLCLHVSVKFLAISIFLFISVTSVSVEVNIFIYCLAPIKGFISNWMVSIDRKIDVTPTCNLYWFRIDTKHMTEPWLDQALMDLAVYQGVCICTFQEVWIHVYLHLNIYVHCISGYWCIRSCVLLNLCINVYCIFVFQGIYISCVYQWIQLYLYPNIFVHCISASLCIDTSLIHVLLYLWIMYLCICVSLYPCVYNM